MKRGVFLNRAFAGPCWKCGVNRPVTYLVMDHDLAEPWCRSCAEEAGIVQRYVNDDFQMVINAMLELDPERKGVGPTAIGMKCGKPYERASAWAHARLKRMVTRGLVERLPGGKYRLLI